MDKLSFIYQFHTHTHTHFLLLKKCCCKLLICIFPWLQVLRISLGLLCPVWEPLATRGSWALEIQIECDLIIKYIQDFEDFVQKCVKYFDTFKY